MYSSYTSSFLKCLLVLQKPRWGSGDCEKLKNVSPGSHFQGPGVAFPPVLQQQVLPSCSVQTHMPQQRLAPRFEQQAQGSSLKMCPGSGCPRGTSAGALLGPPDLPWHQTETCVLNSLLQPRSFTKEGWRWLSSYPRTDQKNGQIAPHGCKLWYGSAKCNFHSQQL